MLRPCDTVEINLDDEQLQISVSDPQKVGEGMSAYVAYKVTTKTNLAYFKKNLFSVSRRFSDFLVLHKNLLESYLNSGIIVPPPPEKSVRAMTKVKLSKNDVLSDDFIEKRRAALERYINRTASHPVLRADSDFHNFLQDESELPKALRGAGEFHGFSRMKETDNKTAFEIDKTIWWFVEKERDFEKLDQEIKKMRRIAESAIDSRKGISTSGAFFVRSATTIGMHKKGTDLSKVFLQLAEVKEMMEALQIEQAKCDVHLLSELLNDYINLMAVARKVFHLRVKAYETWKKAQETFNAKRAKRREIALYRKSETPSWVLYVLSFVPASEKELIELEEKVKEREEEFINISKTIRKEIEHFEQTVVHDIKTTMMKYMEKLLKSHDQMLKYWGEFVPEAKAPF